MLHLLLVCIVWHIEPILQYKQYETYLWFLALKIYCNSSMVIFIIAPKGLWSLPNWHKSQKLKVTKLCGTLRQDGFL